MTAHDIEMALTAAFAPFDRRRYLCVPNVSYGLGLLHECDLLCMSAAGYLTEVEIKVSVSDLKRDADKGHGHRSGIIKALWFAGPARMTLALLDYAPAGAGIVVVCDSAYAHAPTWVGKCVVVWPARPRAGAQAVTAHRRYQLARLGCLRYWDARAEVERMARERAGAANGGAA